MDCYPPNGELTRGVRVQRPHASKPSSKGAQRGNKVHIFLTIEDGKKYSKKFRRRWEGKGGQLQKRQSQNFCVQYYAYFKCIFDCRDGNGGWEFKHNIFSPSMPPIQYKDILH